jgi:hypothetical protein
LITLTVDPEHYEDAEIEAFIMELMGTNEDDIETESELYLGVD